LTFHYFDFSGAVVKSHRRHGFWDWLCFAGCSL
jgi:hypothetical protein